MQKFGNKTIITEALNSLRKCRPTFVLNNAQKEEVMKRLEPNETIKIVRISNGYIWLELDKGERV